MQIIALRIQTLEELIIILTVIQDQKALHILAVFPCTQTELGCEGPSIVKKLSTLHFQIHFTLGLSSYSTC